MFTFILAVMMIPIIYSIAETAKANNLKPFDFFEYLLTEIPKYVDDKNTDFLAELLPFTISLDMQYDLIKKNFPFLSLFHMQYQLLQFLYRHNIFY